MELIAVDLRQLRAFAAVASELNFVRAAKQLRLSQPALSQTIKQLEAHLGLQLFYRDTHSVKLTEAGALIVQDTQDLLNHYQRFIDRARDIGKGRRGTLKIGFLIGAAVDLMPQIIRSFGELYPDVNIELKEFDFSTPEAGIRSGMDVSILRPPIAMEGIELITLMEESCVACLAESHPLAQMESICLADILNEPFIAAPGTGIWRDYWLANNYRDGSQPKVIFEASTFESEFQAVAVGKGISITPMAASRFYARPGLAFPVIKDMPLCKVSIALPDKASPLAKKFAQFATTMAKSRNENKIGA